MAESEDIAKAKGKEADPMIEPITSESQGVKLYSERLSIQTLYQFLDLVQYSSVQSVRKIAMGPDSTKDSFITQDRNEHFEGGTHEATFSRIHSSLT